MKRKLILFILLIVSGCKFNNQTKTVSVFMGSGGSAIITKQHMTVYLNDKKLADTTVNVDDLHPDFDKMIVCQAIDTVQKNNMLINVNGKNTKIYLNNYHSKCIAVHSYYDDVTIMNQKIKGAEDRSVTQKGKKFDVRNFVDSVKKRNPKSKFDTLIYALDLKKCSCGVK